MDENFKYETQPDFNYVIDEKGNTFIALRKIKWGNQSEYKLDLRKYHNTSSGERMSKGVSFITEEGPSELVTTLTGLGYGNTLEVLKSIKDRDDFRSSLNCILDPDDEYYDNTAKDLKEGYFDPKQILD